jgi:FixJ family two-component response regulator
MAAEPVVFIVDDDRSVLTALRRVLELEGLKVATFTSPQAFLDEAAHEGPACVLLDQHMPELSGLDLQRSLAATDGSLAIIFITGRGDVSTSVQAMKAGAFDFLEKPVRPEQLIDVVRRALVRSEAAVAQRQERDAFLHRVEQLTPREREVCALVVRGLLNKQIAYELGTSEKTIKVHRGRVMLKLGVGSVAELARLMERTDALGGRVGA